MYGSISHHNRSRPRRLPKLHHLRLATAWLNVKQDKCPIPSFLSKTTKMCFGINTARLPRLEMLLLRLHYTLRISRVLKIPREFLEDLLISPRETRPRWSLVLTRRVLRTALRNITSMAPCLVTEMSPRDIGPGYHSAMA